VQYWRAGEGPAASGDLKVATQHDFIEGLCRSYQAPLHSYLTQMIGNPDIARELAQESFEQVHRTYRSGEVMFPRAMLYRVATNIARMHLRRRRIERRYWGEAVDMEYAAEVVADHNSPPADREVLAEQIGRGIAGAIKGLRPALRRVFVMAHLQGRTRREIAAELGVSEKRVDKRMSRALRACRELLASLGIHSADVESPREVMEFVVELVADHRRRGGPVAASRSSVVAGPGSPPVRAGLVNAADEPRR
jgi:RNA polymerase sigma factor (sigma-70 family)